MRKFLSMKMPECTNVGESSTKPTGVFSRRTTSATIVITVILLSTVCISFSQLTPSQIQALFGTQASRFSPPRPFAFRFHKDDPTEKFFIPVLSMQVGSSNQLMEYKSAATIARTLNRTLCLSPFFTGPWNHFGNLGSRDDGMSVEDRYDKGMLSRFAKVATLDECVAKCEGRLDAHWRLSSKQPPRWDPRFSAPKVMEDFDGTTPHWSSTRDIVNHLGPRNEPRCVLLAALFPGLRWKGPFIAGSAYLDPSQAVAKATDIFQERAIGSDRFISVHWRFEEMKCSGHQFGLCFWRCPGGAIIANGRNSDRWETLERKGDVAGQWGGINGVSVTKEDVSAAISARAVLANVTIVYLATDGWLRGPESTAIVRWVVEDLRSKKGLSVAGMWQVADLPNFADGTFVHQETTAALFGVAEVSNTLISRVEQEICFRSMVFLGSGGSTWSIAVYDARRSHEFKLETELRMQHEGITDRAAVDRQVIDKLLDVRTYVPGQPGGCNRPGIAKPDDGPFIGWLDYEACEGQQDAGGKCLKIAT